MSVLNCASCGFEVDDQFKFCTSCGAVLQRYDDAITTAEKGKQAPISDEVSSEAVAEQAQVTDGMATAPAAEQASIGDWVSPEVVGEQAQMTEEGSTEAESEQARPITRDGVEPMFTFKYGRAGKPREIRLYEKHVTWHEVAYNQVSVIPFRSIHYLECAELGDGEHVVFMRIANPDINFAISGSAADIAAITERLTRLIG